MKDFFQYFWNRFLLDWHFFWDYWYINLGVPLVLIALLIYFKVKR